jgi:hypothetical protein
VDVTGEQFDNLCQDRQACSRHLLSFGRCGRHRRGARVHCPEKLRNMWSCAVVIHGSPPNGSAFVDCDGCDGENLILGGFSENDAACIANTQSRDTCRWIWRRSRRNWWQLSQNQHDHLWTSSSRASEIPSRANPAKLRCTALHCTALHYRPLHVCGGRGFSLPARG